MNLSVEREGLDTFCRLLSLILWKEPEGAEAAVRVDDGF